MNARLPTDDIIRRIVDAFHPSRVVLFGSHARGEATEDSDVDLMVEMESDLPAGRRAAQVYGLFHPRRWPMDIVVYTPAEAAQQRTQRYSLLSEIERTGKVLYERTHEQR